MNVVPFSFKDKTVRVIEKDGEPWFVGKDVAKALGYSNPRDALGRHCRHAQNVGGSRFPTPPDLDPQTTIIPEGDVYRLIIRSHRPEAREFEALVMDEILPTIRKTGEYSAKTPTHPSMPQLRIQQQRESRLQMRQYLAIGKEIGLSGNQLILSASQAVAKVTGFNPLDAMGITHVDAPTNRALLTPTDIGKQLDGLSAQRVNMMLKSEGFQTSFRNAKGNLVYEPTEKGREIGAVMQDTGKRHGDGVPIRQLKWPSSVIDVLREGGAP